MSMTPQALRRRTQQLPAHSCWLAFSHDRVPILRHSIMASGRHFTNRDYESGQLAV